MSIDRQKMSIVSFAVLTLFSVACQEDKLVDEPPQSALLQFLTQGTWELEHGFLLFANGEEVEVTLDSCDIETWRFTDNLLFMYSHYREGTPPEEACSRAPRRALQSFQLEDSILRLEGSHQDLVNDWEYEGFLISALRITSVEEKIRVTYTIRKEDEISSSSAEVVKIFFLSSRDADDVQ